MTLSLIHIFSVTLEKMYPYADYAKVWIDGNGEVKMLPVSVFYAKKFVGDVYKRQICLISLRTDVMRAVSTARTRRGL